MSSSQAPDGPPLRVISGDASAEEVAAIVAVLASTSDGSDDGGPTRTASRWANPAARMRPVVGHGPGLWRRSSLPH